VYNDKVGLADSLITGFLDNTFESSQRYQPSLLVNDKKRALCVSSTLIHELSLCDEFWFSVAFLTKSGVAVLINSLKEAEERGAKGKILVSQYLNFTQPEALKSLLQFENIELKIATSGNLHSKGYLFRISDIFTIIIGSSNLTANALRLNNELNLKVTASKDSSLAKLAASKLDKDFEASLNVTEDFILSYEELYRSEYLISNFTSDKEHSYKKIKPNSMQSGALMNLERLRSEGQTKALIISATGTGKTLLSAFDVQNFNPKNVLFVVHRRNIAIAAQSTFEAIFGRTRSYGLFSGTERNLDADFVFSTVQTISRDEHLHQIEPARFEYIIIDETHRAGADSYKKLTQHFKPKFLLGMTATPERMDNHDVFADFDHNIACEIRLHQAMEEDILAPFHYFGVTDISIDGEPIDDFSDFNFLVSEQRIDHILKVLALYGCDDGIVRGLIFCSRTDECRKLSAALNSRGLKTVALTGESSEEDRETAIYGLESNLDNERIEYILTVDIFNEGIDIPRVNQIVMLRPTNSAIVFVQQLGRGLRKADGKSYLTVIDFIGNYQNNYLVPIALYGDTSYKKDNLRKLINSGSNTIPGSSTINFDEISRKRIFDSIDQSNLQLFRDLKTDYKLLKYQLGKTPMMMDFFLHGGRDPFAFVEKYGSYYQFVKRVDQALSDDLSQDEIVLLRIFSKEINNASRVEESLATKMLIENGSVSRELILNEIYVRYGYKPTELDLDSAFHNIRLSFATDMLGNRRVSIQEKLGYYTVSETNRTLKPDIFFEECLRNPVFSKYLIDSCDYSIHAWTEKYEKSSFHAGFILYEKYSRKDVFRILNWDQNPLAQNVGGYQISSDRKNCAIFVNYEKHDHSSSTKYLDEFVSPSQFNWMSKNNRRLTSPEIVRFMDHENSLRLPLFIKKSNDEGLDFYYMGELTPIQESFKETTILNDVGNALPVVEASFYIHPHVENDIYEYIANGV
jgi:superfamily II DNA or RNA helicase/HKD family nuclease